MLKKKKIVLYSSDLLPLLSRRKWPVKQSSLSCHGWPILLTSNVVESCCDDLASPLTFAPAVQNLWTRDESNPKGLMGDMWSEEFQLKWGGWFKWPPAAVIAVLPSSCEQILVQSLPCVYEGRWWATRLWVVRAPAQGLWLMRKGIAPQGAQQHMPHWW